MAINITTIPETDFGGGIDSQSSPNQIQPGYIEDALNADPKPTGPIAKRKGYQGYGGNLPVRVKEVKGFNTDDILQFTLDTSIDLSNTTPTPIVVFGKTSISTSGDFISTAS